MTEKIVSSHIGKFCGGQERVDMPVAGENPTHLGETLEIRLSYTSQLSQKLKYDTQCAPESVEWRCVVPRYFSLTLDSCKAREVCDRAKIRDKGNQHMKGLG